MRRAATRPALAESELLLTLSSSCPAPRPRRPAESPFGYSGNQGLDLIGRAMASAAPELARLQAKANAALPPLLRLDVHETDQDIVIRADVPGAVDEGIKIDVDKDNMLRASRSSPFAHSFTTYRTNRFSLRAFRRTLPCRLSSTARRRRRWTMSK